MSMKNPPHPGGFVMRQCIEPFGLTITRAAAALGVTRTTLSELVNEKRGISPEAARATVPGSVERISPRPRKDLRNSPTFYLQFIDS